MGAKYCFFTDPILLAPQLEHEAFGPLPLAANVESFRVTDLHSATAGAPVVAICDGQVCAQAYPDGGLSLILKPIAQPPFDFPYISYFIYKGVARDSLLDTSNMIAATFEDDNELIARILASWSIPENENPGPADHRALGLHLTAAGPVSDPTKYADDKPIDRLFYDGDPDRPPVTVEAGERLGKFGPLFGLEIVVERIGHLPQIGWARTLRHEIPVPKLIGAPALTSVASFQYWHDKEAILDFVDPCAFWGSFLQTGLKASQASSRVKGTDIYPTVLRGSHNDAPDGAFANRNRSYLDIRNEHGQSLNYYKAASVGNIFQLAVGNAGIDDAQAQIDYYGSGWPCCWIENTRLQGLTPAPQGQIEVRFALPKTDYCKPLTYVAVGYVIPSKGKKTLRPLNDQERFINRPGRAASPYLEPGTIAAPLVTVGGQPKFAAAYQKISHFKRYDRSIPPPAPNVPVDLAPIARALLDHVLPVPADPVFPRNTGGVLVKTYADNVFVAWPSAWSVGFVARPGFVRDGSNIYIFLLPTCRFLFNPARKDGLEAGQLVFQDINYFPSEYLKAKGGQGFKYTTLNPPPTGTVVRAIDEDFPGSVRKPTDAGSDFIVLAMSKSSYEAGVAPANQLLAGTSVLSLALSERRLDANGRTYREALIAYSCLSRPAQPAAGAMVSRSETPTLATLYAYADF